MWARVVEVMLGCWLAVSPFVFRISFEDRVLWFNDLLSALGIIVLALVSFWPAMQFAHVVNFAIGIWLIAFGFLASPASTPPGLQNDIVVGLLLLMLAIIPNHASQPPRSWRDFLVRRSNNAS
jgi:hypothetical protein